MPTRTKDVNPGDSWEYKDHVYQIIGTAIMTGTLKDIKLAIVYCRPDHPLMFVRERMEFLDKFKWVKGIRK